MELYNIFHNIIKVIMLMNRYVTKIHTIIIELTIARHVIDESIFTFVFLRGLLLEYISFITKLNAQHERQSPEDMIARIIAHEMMMTFK